MSANTPTPEIYVRRVFPHVNSWLVAVVALLAIVVAGIAGYAIAGGSASEPSRGQAVADRVMNAFATPDDPVTIAAAYDPAIKSVLFYDGIEHVMATSAKEQAEALKAGLLYGNSYKLIGPVSTYEAANGDLYVGNIIEVKGPGHPNGDPIIGFWRVHNGKVVQQIGIDAAHP